MDDPLVQFLAGQPLAEGLRHVVHEIHHQLPFLRHLLPLLIDAFGLLATAVKRHQHEEGAKQKSDDEQQHDAKGWSGRPTGPRQWRNASRSGKSA